MSNISLSNTATGNVNEAITSQTINENEAFRVYNSFRTVFNFSTRFAFSWLRPAYTNHLRQNNTEDGWSRHEYRTGGRRKHNGYVPILRVYKKAIRLEHKNNLLSIYVSYIVSDKDYNKVEKAKIEAKVQEAIYEAGMLFSYENKKAKGCELPKLISELKNINIVLGSIGERQHQTELVHYDKDSNTIFIDYDAIIKSGRSLKQFLVRAAIMTHNETNGGADNSDTNENIEREMQYGTILQQLFGEDGVIMQNFIDERDTPEYGLY